MKNAQIKPIVQMPKSQCEYEGTKQGDGEAILQLETEISHAISGMSSIGVPKYKIEKYAKMASSPKVAEMLCQFDYDQSAKSKIWEGVSNILMHLDNENVNNQKLVNTLCDTISRISSDPQEAIVALDLIDKSCKSFSSCESIKEKSILHMLEIINFNEDHKDVYPIGIDMQELIEPQLFKLIDGYDKNRSTKDEFLNLVLSYLGIKHPSLLTEREKERLLLPQQTRIEYPSKKQLKRLSIGKYVQNNSNAINEFLEVRLHNLVASQTNNTRILGFVQSVSKSLDASKNKEELIGMFTFGINGSRDQEKQVKYRKLLQQRFAGIDSGKAFEKWKIVKNVMLQPLIEACKNLDTDKQSSIDEVLYVFKQGIEKLPNEDRKELQQLYEKITAALSEESDRKIIAYTLQNKDNVINVEAGRIRACTFIDNPIGSYAMFDYALDPSIILINYSILKGQHINQIDVGSMTVYGMAICALGKFSSEHRKGSMLFVDSVEGGLDFKDFAVGMETRITESIVRKAAEIGAEYVGFYTNVFPDTYSKLFVDSIDLKEETANVMLETNRKQYLDSLRREQVNDDGSIKTGVKIINVNTGIREAVRK